VIDGVIMKGKEKEKKKEKGDIFKNEHMWEMNFVVKSSKKAKRDMNHDSSRLPFCTALDSQYDLMFGCVF